MFEFQAANIGTSISASELDPRRLNEVPLESNIGIGVNNYVFGSNLSIVNDTTQESSFQKCYD